MVLLRLMGFDPFAAEFGPGTLMYDFVIHASYGEEILRFDMLRGEENYKRLWEPALKQLLVSP